MEDGASPQLRVKSANFQCHLFFQSAARSIQWIWALAKKISDMKNENTTTNMKFTADISTKKNGVSEQLSEILQSFSVNSFTNQRHAPFNRCGFLPRRNRT